MAQYQEAYGWELEWLLSDDLSEATSVTFRLQHQTAPLQTIPAQWEQQGNQWRAWWVVPPGYLYKGTYTVRLVVQYGTEAKLLTGGNTLVIE